MIETVMGCGGKMKNNIKQVKKDELKQQRNENESQVSTIGVWGFYEELFKNNWIFLNTDAAIGDNLLKPMNTFYRVALQNNIEIKSLDGSRL